MKDKGLTPRKALTILQEGRIRGNRITEKQMRYFGAIAGGEIPQPKK